MMTLQIGTDRTVATVRVLRKVVVVSRNAGQCLPDSVMDAEDYDVVVLESPTRAYSQIKRVKPNLVIMCFSFDDLESFQVLSMLKVDVETSGIPVRMYAASHSDGFIEDALHVDEVGASSQTNVSASLN